MAGREAMGEGLPLLSGQIVVYQRPDVRLAFIDILHGGANQKRYQGQLGVSLLHHSLLCALLAEIHYPDSPHIKRAAAAHDLHEVYFPDITRDLKRLWPGVKDLERPWEAHVHGLLGLAYPRDEETEEAVKHIDNRAVAVEVFTWGHSRKQWFYPYHGGPPTADERLAGSQVCHLRAIELYNLLRRVLPELPAPGS